MKRILSSFFRQIVFWLLFFGFTRLVFLIYNIPLLLAEKIGFIETIKGFWFALKLDLATTCYIMVIPFLILAVQSFLKKKWLSAINRWYTYIIIMLYTLATAAELGIYPEWKTKLTYKALKYLQHPSEIYNSAETGTFFLLLSIFLALSAAGILLFKKFFTPSYGESKRKLLFNFLFILMVPVLLFLGMRGGIQQIPINQSESYYSDHNILNIAAVNTAFNLYISVFENLENFNNNPYLFMDDAQASRIMKKIYQTPCDSTKLILKTDRPNIVLLILESWSADLIQSLGGEPGITPEFRKLEQEGILFTNVYASGSRSEQGLASILSGFPAHPVSSITVQPDKFVKLPSMVKTLEQSGYSTAFYFGGQLIYGNIKSYIIFNGFDKIMEVSDFPGSTPRGKLGIHDQFTLGYLVEDARKLKEPFFTALFTLSTHSPWDQPFEKPLKWGDNEQEYINGAYYTDHCLGQFFKKARTKPWYDNTLFIIVADHSHNSYRNWHPQSREYHLIPMLFCGNVIRDQFKGTREQKLGNQHDIAATLLRQMNLQPSAFFYSKNLLNPCSPDFAYYSTDDGVGWVRPPFYFTIDKTSSYNYWWNSPALPDSIRKEGEAYLQTVFEDYMHD